MGVRNKYLYFLEKKWGIKCELDWYKKKVSDVENVKGGCTFLRKYEDSLLKALIELKPKVEWKSYKFTSHTKHFFIQENNRKDFIDNFCKETKRKTRESYLSITMKELRLHGGLELYLYFKGDICKLINELLIPHPLFVPWEFRNQNHSWNDSNYLRNYFEWLKKEMEWKKDQDLYKITKKILRDKYAGSLTKKNLLFYLRKAYPDSNTVRLTS